MSCGVSHRRSSDPTLLWLWHRLAATALLRPLAWELPHAVGAALKKDTHTHTHKIHSKWFKALNAIHESTGNKLPDICLEYDFLDLTPKAKATKAKISKRGHMKLKICRAKEAITKMKDNLLNGRK